MMKDGMDMSMCIIDKTTQEFIFCGANNPIYFLRKNIYPSINVDKKMEGSVYTLYELPSTKHFVGGVMNELNETFKDVHFTLYPDDIFYLFSDGFPDQFGGEKNKKFMYKPLKSLLLSMNDEELSLNTQYERLENSFNAWKGNNDQTDDVTIIGIKI